MPASSMTACATSRFFADAVSIRSRRSFICAHPRFQAVGHGLLGQRLAEHLTDRLVEAGGTLEGVEELVSSIWGSAQSTGDGVR